METKSCKCSVNEHKEIDAISFCHGCQIYMCNKCEKYHSILFKNSHKIETIKDKNMEVIFTGLCKENNHLAELIYFCKNHNKLCCAFCITKIKDDENGQHKDCDVCSIKDIEKEKKNNLKENIEKLEELSLNLQQSINEIKILFEKIEKDKEKIKVDIQNIFTKFRNELNDKEDKLLLEFDKKYGDQFISENILKESEELPNKIKENLNKGKLIDNNWKNNKLNFAINDCINIEENIKYINKINESIIKCKNSKNSNINVFLNENEIIESIKKISLINIFFESNIEFDQQLVKSWLNNKNFSAKLLFRKTRDGSTTKDFHNKCDNQGITIIFIETTKGYKFGGYTELEWESKECSKKDKSTFIFSLNNKQKYTPRNDNSTIYCDPNYCPWFGSSNYPEIYFQRKTLNKGQSYDYQNSNTFFNGRKLTNGEEFWDVKELEVFKIKL